MLRRGKHLFVLCCVGWYVQLFLATIGLGSGIKANSEAAKRQINDSDVSRLYCFPASVAGKLFNYRTQIAIYIDVCHVYRGGDSCVVLVQFNSQIHHTHPPSLTPHCNHHHHHTVISMAAPDFSFSKEEKALLDSRYTSNVASVQQADPLKFAKWVVYRSQQPMSSKGTAEEQILRANFKGDTASTLERFNKVMIEAINDCDTILQFKKYSRMVQKLSYFLMVHLLTTENTTVAVITKNIKESDSLLVAIEARFQHIKGQRLQAHVYRPGVQHLADGTYKALDRGIPEFSIQHEVTGLAPAKKGLRSIYLLSDGMKLHKEPNLIIAPDSTILESESFYQTIEVFKDLPSVRLILFESLANPLDSESADVKRLFRLTGHFEA